MTDIGRQTRAIAFVRRVPRSEEALEDIDSARLVIAYQAGDIDSFRCIYSRYFERVFTYLRIALDDEHEAEDAAQQVFLKAFEALPDYERWPGRPFRAWLFTVLRNHVIKQRQRSSRLDVVDPSEIEAYSGSAPPDEHALGWLTDTDMLVLIRRLPQAQRQVLLLRYLLDLSVADVAVALDRSPNEISVMQHRALAFLRARLTALGRQPRGRTREPTRRRGREASVLRARRFALQLEQRSTSVWAGRP